jgi:hypothetical protein
MGRPTESKDGGPYLSGQTRDIALARKALNLKVGPKAPTGAVGEVTGKSKVKAAAKFKVGTLRQLAES